MAYKGDIVDLQQIEKYLKSGLKYFYVTKNDFENFGKDFFKEDLVNLKLFNNKIEGLSKKHEILHGIVNDFGVSKFVIDQVEDSIDEIEDKINTLNNDDLLSLFESSKGTFLYDHAFLTIIFSHMLCKGMDWYNDSIKEKLALAAMVHDLGISDPKLALSEVLGLNDILRMDSKTSIELTNHPKVIANILSRNPEIPIEVINICLSHHEGEEDGYPRGVDFSNLSQLERVFILSHAMAVGLYRIAFKLDKFSSVIDGIKARYSCGNFAPILDEISTKISSSTK